MPREFRGDMLEHALHTARLHVPAERVEALRANVESVYSVIDRLDTLDLGETPPATALNARWE
jgi:Asp-tRNA(Asn)/Glu-tRNA(Gln) amidotransferase C subunit